MHVHAVNEKVHCILHVFSFSMALCKRSILLYELASLPYNLQFLLKLTENRHWYTFSMVLYIFFVIEAHIIKICMHNQQSSRPII